MSDYMVLETLISNGPLVATVIFAAIYLREKPNSKPFLVGLLIILLSGLVAIPYSFWTFDYFSDLLRNSSLAVSVATLPIGLLQAFGLVLCVLAFAKK